uniref:Putative reverse transcriptase, RNA-dependent DNA polymerase n=1 Tax=Tanacetum cinerariifolium TaxID=118510 RepID=A0A6L2J1A9_TANCI|nr:putative reverse transcriptase, RNA-dependent DNA polymerase [Tanacetum cinerariifolium]
MGFMVYQMDVKSAFIYETIEKEVYVYKSPGFEDRDHPGKVYKVVKALYGLHQAPRACDYAGASLDRKSTTGGWQFLGCRLISWQCKKQTVIATSSTEAEYIAAASCRALVLWIQNQLLDYGYNFMHTFWNTVTIKQSNDVARLQALVDRKKVVLTETVIRDVLCLDDAEGVDCLPNEEIFTEMAHMDYEKPSTKLTFYKNQLGDLSTHTTKYISPALTQKVFVNMRRVGKGCSEVETPLFEGMLVAGEPKEQDDAEEQVQGNDNDAAQGADTAISGDDVQDQSIPSPTPLTPPPQPPQDIPSISQVQSPSPQPQSPTPAQPQGADFPMSLLQEALDACAALIRRVEHLEHDRVAQDLEITKMKTRVKKLERANKRRMIAELDRDEGIALMDDEGAEKKAEDAHVADDEQVKRRQAEIYQIDMDHAAKVLSMQEDEPEVQEALEVVTTAKLITKVVAAVSESVSVASATIADVSAATVTTTPVRVAAASTRRRKGVVIRDPEKESTVKIPNETKSKYKGKGIMVEEPKPIKKKQQVEMDEEFARKLHEELNQDIDWDVAIDHVKQKAKEDPYVQRYQIGLFKGMSYEDIHPIFEAKFNSNIEFFLKSKEQIEEEENRALESINETPAQKAAKRRRLNEEVEDVEDLKQHLEIVPDEDDDVYTEATPLARKVPVVDYQIIQLNNKPRYKIIRADGTHQLYNSHKRTVGTDTAFAMSWRELMKLMVEVYCLRNEIQKIESELWNLTMKNNDLDAYTQRFQELTMLCSNMVLEEEDRVKKFIGGLPDNIQENRDPVVNQRVTICFECKRQEHYRNECPKLKNQNRGNKAGKKTEEARGKAYVLGGREGNPDSNVVTVEFGSFDVIIDMDWLSKHHAVIVCDEKIVWIPYGDEVLIVQCDGSDKGKKSKLSIISCAKTQKY